MILWLRLVMLVTSLALFFTIAFMIFVPSLVSKTWFAHYFDKLNVGHVTVLDSSNQVGAVPLNADPFILYGLCRFDIRQNDFEIELPFWHDYWSISFLTLDGKTTLNLSRRPLINEQEHLLLTRRSFQVVSSERQKTQSRLNPQADQGLVLFRLAVVNDEVRTEGVALLQNLVCRTTYNQLETN